MYAIIQTGGKQYKVTPNQPVKIEKLPAEVGQEVEFNEVLLVDNEDGKDVKIGAPLVTDAVVKGKVLDQGRADKISVVHYKAKTRQHKRVGHRQAFTNVQITSIA